MRKSARGALTVNLKSLECFRVIIDKGTAAAAAKHLRLTRPLDPEFDAPDCVGKYGHRESGGRVDAPRMSERTRQEPMVRN